MSHARLYANPPGLVTNAGDPAAHILGVPFDSTHSYRPGCRFAPDYIRDMMNNIEAFHPDVGVDLERAAVRDAGNLVHTVDPAAVLRMTERVVGELRGDGAPVMVLGGEHLVTLGSYSAFPEDTALVVLDAHYDMRDEYAGTRLGHASFLRRIIERRGADRVMHAGGRAFAAEELAFLMESGVRTVSDGDIRDGRGAAALREFCGRHDSVYVSVDMDVLDPAYCPGVGNPEACGLTSREALDLVRAVSGPRLVGCDIVELNPTYDTGAGGALAAKMLSTMIAGSLAGGGARDA